jgi:hypothetical protein
LVGHLNGAHGTEKRLDRFTDRLFPRQKQISPNLTAEGAGKMIPIKSTGRTLTEMQELEAMAAELLKTARKLPPGPVRHDLLKEIGKFRARIIALKAKGKGK